MSAAYQIEKGIPMPVIRPRGSLTPEQKRRLAADKQRRRTEAHKARGFCVFGGHCRQRPAEGHTLCLSHLEYLRESAVRRLAEKKANGQCRQCDRHAFAGMVTCLIHRKGNSLPNVVRRGLSEYRRREAERERAEERAAISESVRAGLHLLKPRHQQIILLRFGLDGAKERTLQEVADIVGLTRERVRQIEENAMFKIESEYPIPNGYAKRGEIAETLEAMEVGQSFLCRASQKQEIYKWAKRLNFVVTSRKQEDGQHRVWLVSKSANG